MRVGVWTMEDVSRVKSTSRDPPEIFFSNVVVTLTDGDFCPDLVYCVSDIE